MKDSTTADARHHEHETRAAGRPDTAGPGRSWLGCETLDQELVILVVEDREVPAEVGGCGVAADAAPGQGPDRPRLRRADRHPGAGRRGRLFARALHPGFPHD